MTERSLTPVSSTGCSQRCLGRCATVVAAFLDTLPLHVGNLREHRNDQFADASANGTEAEHIHGHALCDQMTNRCLNIEGVSTEPVHGRDADDISVAGIAQQRSKAGTLRSGGRLR